MPRPRFFTVLGRPRSYGTSALPRLLVLGALVAAQGCLDPSQGDDESLEAQREALTADAAPPSKQDAGIPPKQDGGSIDPIDGSVVVPGDGGFVILDGGGPIFPDGGIGGGGGPIGQWNFDDCRSGISTLRDSSPAGVNAQKSASVVCADGVSGLGLLFDEKKDTVEASNAQTFALSTQLTVAAWINPSQAGQGSIVNKDKPAGTAFSLSLDKKQVVFGVTVQKKNKTQLFTSSITVPLHKWTHVAGVYDGQFVRLFMNGQQVGQVSAPGSIADVSAPIRIGNDRNNAFFPGRLDSVQLFNRALADFELAQLSCFAAPLTVAVTPANAGNVDANNTIHYDLAIANQDVGACSARQLFVSLPTVEGIAIGAPQSFVTVSAGTSAHVAIDVTPSDDLEPGPQDLQVSLFDFNGGSTLSADLRFTLNTPSGCFVRTSRELFMRDLSVVEDPVRTAFTSSPEDARTGAWTFARLMQQAAPSAAQAPDMVEKVLRTWLSDQTINSFLVPARSAMQQVVLDGWPRLANGKLDLTRAPVRLLGIVNRLDLRDLAKGKAGEGRFVFGVLNPQGNGLQFTIILEYALPATTTDDVLAWANQWHALSALPFPSEQYNTALQAVTDRFSKRGALPSAINGSALLRFRTNEIELSNRWELREFVFGAATGMLEPNTVELTPDTGFINESRLVADYVNQNEASVLLEQHVIPNTFEGQPFLGGDSFNDIAPWVSSGITNPEARFRFSLNTCNGCHGAETQTGFLHVNPREAGQVSFLSAFMTGETAFDPVSGVARTLNDLGRRNADLKAIVCGGTASTITTPLPAGGPQPATVARAAATVSSASRTAFLSKGIGRVH